MFTVINLCTDCETVVEYYNDLDVIIGNELSGLDVIDDFRAEGLEVNAKNNFFVYTFHLHTARMAGCYSVVADMMDEDQLPLPYVHKLIKELLVINDHTLNINETTKYLTDITIKNNQVPRVYNYITKQFSTPLDIHKLKTKLYILQMTHMARKQMLAITPYINKYDVGGLIGMIFALFVLYKSQ